jgi:hypothetical protein
MNFSMCCHNRRLLSCVYARCELSVFVLWWSFLNARDSCLTRSQGQRASGATTALGTGEQIGHVRMMSMHHHSDDLIDA